jgi:4-carboxymuconolactone decarboxylase
MDDHGKKVYDRIVSNVSRPIVGLRGPAGISLHSPRLAELQTAVFQYLRFETGLSEPMRELAILVTAREMDSQFEWTAHEPIALKEGLSQEMIDVVKYRRDVAELPETEQVIIQFGREMFRNKKVTSETFARALKIFGPKQLVDLVALMANYCATAVRFYAFDMQVDPEKKSLLPLS